MVWLVQREPCFKLNKDDVGVYGLLFAGKMFFKIFIKAGGFQPLEIDSTGSTVIPRQLPRLNLLIILIFHAFHGKIQNPLWGILRNKVILKHACTRAHVMAWKAWKAIWRGPSMRGNRSGNWRGRRGTIIRYPPLI